MVTEQDISRLSAKFMQICNVAREKNKEHIHKIDKVLDLIASDKLDLVLDKIIQEANSDINAKGGKATISEIFKEKPRARIIIIGDCWVPKHQIYGMVKELGIPNPKERLDLIFSYEEIKKSFSWNRLKNSLNYIGIILGPVPHKINNLGNFQNLSQKLLGEIGFPPFVEARTQDKKGVFKITKSSLKAALIELISLIEQKGIN
ncbi:MAG: hypothetical protein US50_C0002G0026 [Candidatus Nomurabacteria bacterium GW2011_GWB1_37_5]|uniref:Uncharacterized protein n=1 Tax=Candidatus Nomurabacteria bacterium GW2011_GWB1_37_5 TaxID=1618742 RepID=A0A0G0K5N6_9BACT|nr:MAG: hypothetical protein US50_C0002G0026 [Candidatus Nomurabacteria bacterium GW2011_GWB1_37_5]